MIKLHDTVWKGETSSSFSFGTESSFFEGTTLLCADSLFLIKYFTQVYVIISMVIDSGVYLADMRPQQVFQRMMVKMMRPTVKPNPMPSPTPI